MHSKRFRRKYTILIRWAAFGKRVESRPRGRVWILGKQIGGGVFSKSFSQELWVSWTRAVMIGKVSC